MVKAVKYSAMAREIKKEYLIDHLENIKQLITEWMSQLDIPNPFAPRDGIWNWQSGYSPNLEKDQDSNHMLRHHLRSRALWSHHAEWENKLNDLWDSRSHVRELAEDHYSAKLRDEQKKQKENYIGVTLWVVFNSIYSGKSVEVHYKVPDDQLGVAIGDFKIELSASTTNERSLIEIEHKDFIHYLAKLEPLRELSALWQEIQDIEEKMRALASKALKSNDILYTCKFCRHLWK